MRAAVLASTRSNKLGVDTEAPSVPTGLSSSAICQNTFTLSWNASTDNVGVTGYKVFDDGVLDATLGNVTTYNAVFLGPGTTSTWTVSALDAAGNESAQSTGLSVTQSETVNSIVTSGAQSTAAAACSAAKIFTRYITGGDSTPSNSEIVYTDACATNEFIGLSNFYATSTISFQVNNSGVISNIGLC